MKTVRWFAVVLTFVLLSVGTSFTAQAQEGETVKLEFKPGESAMKVTGTSTVHDWKCADITKRGFIAVDRSAVTKGVLDLNRLADVLKQDGGETPVTKLTVPVKEMHCEKEGMDPKMYTALKAEEYPEIKFDLESVSVMETPDSEKNVLKLRSEGTLSIAGVEREITMPVVVKKIGESVVEVTGKKALKMSQFKIERPTAMWGTIQAYDDITVHFNMRARLLSDTKKE